MRCARSRWMRSSRRNRAIPGMPMGMADIATVLFTKFLRFDPRAPGLARPRPLRAVHRARLDAALCAAASDRLPDMTLDELKHFRQLGSRTAGHPERGHASGIETTTGPLGQGSAIRSAWRSPSGMLAAEFGERDRRSLHLCHRQRRRPDGGYQPRGGLARRASRPQQADRALRRQLDFDRRPDQLAFSDDQLCGSGRMAGPPSGSTATITERSPRRSGGRRRAIART